MDIPESVRVEMKKMGWVSWERSEEVALGMGPRARLIWISGLETIKRLVIFIILES